MKKGENYNRPKKGSIVRGDPIKNIEHVRLVREHLKKKNLQKYAIFVIGTNTNLRAIDLSNLKAKDVAFLKPFDTVKIREQKTNKYREVVLNKPCIEAIRLLLKQRGNVDGYLFQGAKGGRISTQYQIKMVKQACREVGLPEGNYTSHTMRKTWGYHQYRTFGARIEDLMWCFNHSKPRQTMDYLCLSVEEVSGTVYSNEI